MALLGPRCYLTCAPLIRLQLNVSYVTAQEVITHSHSACVCGSTWGNPHMKHFWFGAFLLFLLLLGVYSWYAIAPVDLPTRIEHYVLAPLLIAFALVMLLLLWALSYDR